MPKADDILKWVSIVPIIASIVGGTIAFFVQRYDDMGRLDREALSKEQEARSNELKAKKMFLDKQFELYFEAVQIASRLATTASLTNLEPDWLRFRELYWGQLGMVEDGPVSDAMTLVRNAYGARLTAETPDTARERDLANECAKNLPAASLILSHCIRKSLERSWNVKLQPGADDFCTHDQFNAVLKSCPNKPDGWNYKFRYQGSKGDRR